MRLTVAIKGTKKMLVGVASFEDAASTWSRIRNESGIGASGMLGGCGEVVEDGKVVARISYNGRIWDAEGKEIVPVSGDRIILTVEDGWWMATFAGPQQAQVTELFGTSKLPTAFRDSMDQREVVANIVEKNPGMDVVVNGILMGGVR